MKYQVVVMFEHIAADVEVHRRTKGEAVAQAKRWAVRKAPGWNTLPPRRIEVRRLEHRRMRSRYVPVLVGTRVQGTGEWVWR